MIYIGMTERLFKMRFYVYMQGFRNKSKKDSTNINLSIRNVSVIRVAKKPGITWNLKI